MVIPRRALSAVAVLGAVTALVILTRPRDDQGDGSQPTSEPSLPQLRLLDANVHGAVVADSTRRVVLGLDARGRTRWRDAVAYRDGSDVSCLARCPDAVVSGSLDSLNRAEVADPPIRFRIGAAERVDPHPHDLKARVLTATSPTDLVAVRGDGVHARLEFRVRGRPTLRVAVPSDLVELFGTADRRRVLALTSQRTRPGTTVQWFQLSRSGWHARGAARSVAAETACTSSDGHSALLAGVGLTRLEFGSTRSRVLAAPPHVDLSHTGQCALNARGEILAEMVQHGNTNATTATAVSARGHLLWRRTFAGFPTRLLIARVGLSTAIVNGSVLTILDPRGKMTRMPGVADAALLARDLLVLTTRGKLRHVGFPAG